MKKTLAVLEGTEAFSNLGEKALAALSRIAVRRELAENEILFRQGEAQESVYVVISGEIEISRKTGPRVEQLMVTGPGQAIGESALILPDRHSTTARTLAGVSLLELPRRDVLKIFENDAPAMVDLVVRIASMMSRKLQYTSASRVGIEKAYASGMIRREHDLLGDKDVPMDALYGVQTIRAVENFSITGVPLSHFPNFVRSLAMVKQAAVRANRRLGLIEPGLAGVIDRVCQEIINGRWHGHFVVDMIQGGAGTSTNMNANEVIANRALELLGHSRGEYEHCHPNNHVNLSQSTNDVYPSAIRIAALFSMKPLEASLAHLAEALAAKGEETKEVIKMGRTQLQDAVPMTLGQEFSAWAETIREDVAMLGDISQRLLNMNMGGTAIGTGINTDPRYPGLVIEELKKITGLDVILAENLVEATPDTGDFVIFSGALKRVAVKLSKLCNDLRLLSSGPRCGLNEINLPPMQPGSSIMPGKVNPVIPEVVNQVAFQVIGNDLTITLAAEAGQLELNVMEPIIAFNFFQSLEMMAESVDTLTCRCIRGITANTAHCRDMVEKSVGVVTAVVPKIGYEKASEVAKEALETATPVREILLRKGYMTEKEIDELLSPESMTGPRPMRIPDPGDEAP
jgi:aspartate ammonia-lyase